MCWGQQAYKAAIFLSVASWWLSDERQRSRILSRRHLHRPMTGCISQSGNQAAFEGNSRSFFAVVDGTVAYDGKHSNL